MKLIRPIMLLMAVASLALTAGCNLLGPRETAKGATEYNRRHPDNTPPTSVHESLELISTQARTVEVLCKKIRETPEIQQKFALFREAQQGTDRTLVRIFTAMQEHHLRDGYTNRHEESARLGGNMALWDLVADEESAIHKMLRDSYDEIYEFNLHSKQAASAP